MKNFEQSTAVEGTGGTDPTVFTTGPQGAMRWTARVTDKIARILAAVGLVLGILALIVALSGCSLVPGYDKAVAAYEASKGDFEATAKAFDRAAQDVRELQTAYEAAVNVGDKSKAQALLETLPAALSKLENMEKAAGAATTSFETARRQFEDANSAQDYIGTILGLVGGLLGGGLGGNVLGKRSAKKATA